MTNEQKCILMSEIVDYRSAHDKCEQYNREHFRDESSRLMEEIASRHRRYLHNLDDSIVQFFFVVLVFARCTM